MSNSGYLLIADISGYTNFVKLHNLRQKNVLGKIIADNFEFHAEAIVSDLLEAVIEVIEPTLKLNKLEGDAAFFYIESNDSKNQADDITAIKCLIDRGNLKDIYCFLYPGEDIGDDIRSKINKAKTYFKLDDEYTNKLNELLETMVDIPSGTCEEEVSTSNYSSSSKFCNK